MDIAAVPARCNSIRYSDQGSYRWLWTHAPYAWQGKIELHFANVPMNSLSPAGCRTDPAIVAAHLRHIRAGRALTPLVVSANGRGGWYIHDGNHRYRALREFFKENDQALVRAAVAAPNPGFKFVYRWSGSYGTHLLEPAAPLLGTGPFIGRAMILLAHQDDEAACAGLLQRLDDPIVAYATNGAPADKHFWGRYGSRANYAAVRREEAKTALAKVGVVNPNFLNDHAPVGVEFRDQDLCRVLLEVFEAVSDLIYKHRPDTVLVPTYEGGHPDHDSCSFLGAMLQRRFGLSVWEMPLYHRSEIGELICQQFRVLNGTERAVVLSRKERQLRDSMIASYASQTDVVDFVSSGVEFFRPQPKYDYAQPPHEGTVNYEAWQWPISANEVCQAFEYCTRRIEKVQPDSVPLCAVAEHEQSHGSSAGA